MDRISLPMRVLEVDETDAETRLEWLKALVASH
jgi:hypothetical protein